MNVFFAPSPVSTRHVLHFMVCVKQAVRLEEAAASRAADKSASAVAVEQLRTQLEAEAAKAAGKSFGYSAMCAILHAPVSQLKMKVMVVTCSP